MSGSDIVKNFYRKYYADQAFLSDAAFRDAWRKALMFSANRSAVSDPTPDVEVTRRIADAIDKLDQEDLRIFCLRHFEKLSNREVAQQLGIGEATAGIRYLRTVRQIREILSGDADG